MCHPSNLLTEQPEFKCNAPAKNSVHLPNNIVYAFSFVNARRCCYAVQQPRTIHFSQSPHFKTDTRNYASSKKLETHNTTNTEGMAFSDPVFVNFPPRCVCLVVHTNTHRCGVEFKFVFIQHNIFCFALLRWRRRAIGSDHLLIGCSMERNNAVTRTRLRCAKRNG